MSNEATRSVPILRTTIPGPESEALWESSGHLNSPGLSAPAVESKLSLSHGSGCWVEDVDGNLLLDFCSGAVVNILGHAHPQLVDALGEELSRFIHSYDFHTPARDEFLQAVTEVLPDHLDRIQMYVGGTETVEAALRLAISYTGKSEFLSLYRGYHGKSLGSRSLLGGGYKRGFGTPAAGYYQTPNAYCYRCPLGLVPESCDTQCADMVQQVFEQQTSGDVAALVMEPIQGAGGIIQPPQRYVEKMRDFCDERGLLLIFDEILTSFGRTGELFAHHHYGVEPDVMTLGKGSGGGYPVGLLAASQEVMESWPWDQPFGGSTTFGGGGVAARAVLTTLRILTSERLVENAATVGAHVKARLIEMQERYPVIGDVRGAGLLLGLELVRDRESKEQISQDEARAFFRSNLERGLLLNTIGPIVRITPPLVISREEADTGLDILDASLSDLQSLVNQR